MTNNSTRLLTFTEAELYEAILEAYTTLRDKPLIHVPMAEALDNVEESARMLLDQYTTFIAQHRLIMGDFD